MKRIILFLFVWTVGWATELPYPVILIHGLDSDDQTWNSFLNETLRPALDNPDVPVFNVLANSDLSETRWQGTDGIIGTDDDDILVANPGGGSTVPVAPVYAINFRCWRSPDPPYLIWPHVSRDATPYNLANNSAGNESAIVKEGIALGWVIGRVLSATGKDKVILVGHSAGGLVAREYLQRTDAEGQHIRWAYPSEEQGHRVAKLVTIGTPHLGSNYGLISISKEGATPGRPEGQRFSMPNDMSELVRDLRISYDRDLDPRGVYLFGGNESEAHWEGFHNSDIDCNGRDDDQITGISDWDTWSDNPNMRLPSGADYLWIKSNSQGNDDGIVEVERQYLHTIGDTMLTAVDHGDETSDSQSLIRGLDQHGADPWKISPANTIRGWITYQPNMLSADEDRYVLDNNSVSTLTFHLGGASDLVIHIHVTKSDGTVILDTDKGLGLSISSEVQSVSPGALTIVLSGNANSNSWMHPYRLTVDQSFDTTPPDRITDLQGFNPQTHSVELHWTAAGDDHLSGTGLHTLRWFEQSPTEGNFDQGHPVFGNQPYPGGSSALYTVQLPYANSTYFLAIKVCDESGNCSELSNVCTVWTLPQPELPTPTIVYYEYFFDNDPGPGNGTGMTIIGVTGPSVTRQLDISSLAPGFHRFYLRYLSSQNIWSAAEGRAFYVTPPASLESVQINYAEIFYDTDPGVNIVQGHAVTPGTIVTFASNQDISNLTPGFHKAFLRFRTDHNLWSTAEGRAFYVTPPATLASSTINAAEMFYDTDPGAGAGQALTLTAAPDVSLTANQTIRSLAPGFHRAFLRYKTDHNIWSAAEGRAFYVTPPGSPGDDLLTSAEYYLDTDPGAGHGTAVDFEDAPEATVTHSISPFSASTGFHRLFLRYRTNHALWSAAEGRALFVTPPEEDEAVFVAGGETFIDQLGDPGLGMSLSADDGNFDQPQESMHRNLPVSEFSEGLHYVYARVRDSRGLWSNVAMDSFVVGIPAEIKLVIFPQSADSLRLTWTGFPGAAEYQVHYDSLPDGEFASYIVVQAPDTAVSVQSIFSEGMELYHVVAILPARSTSARSDRPNIGSESHKDNISAKRFGPDEVIAPVNPIRGKQLDAPAQTTTNSRRGK